MLHRDDQENLWRSSFRISIIKDWLGYSSSSQMLDQIIDKFQTLLHSTQGCTNHSFSSLVSSSAILTPHNFFSRPTADLTVPSHFSVYFGHTQFSSWIPLFTFNHILYLLFSCQFKSRLSCSCTQVGAVLLLWAALIFLYICALCWSIDLAFYLFMFCPLLNSLSAEILLH